MRFKPHFVLGSSLFVSNTSTASWGHLALELPRGEGPFRGGGQPRWFVVRRPSAFDDDPHFQWVFESSVEAMVALRGTPAARAIACFGDDTGIRALVIEDLFGTPVGELLRKLGPLPVPTVLELGQRLVPLWLPDVPFVLGIDELILTSDGRVRADVELSALRAQQVVGAAVLPFQPNISYISPEEVRGAPRARQSGMFTLGMLLFEMLSGRHPFFEERPESVFQLLRAIATERPPSLGEVSDVATPVVGLVDRMLAHDPADRFESWPTLYDQLADLLGTEPATPLIELVPPELLPKPRPLPDLSGWQGTPRESWRELPLPSVVEADVTTARPTPPMLRDRDVEYSGNDHRPMFRVGSLLIDADCVSVDEFERFRIAIGGSSNRPSSSDPVTQVSYEDALAYAQWAGKRLPSDAEWSTCVQALGADRLRTGLVWEWTSTPQQGGWVVRGGRWRNRLDQEPEPNNASFETDPAVDVGFRCVAP